MFETNKFKTFGFRKFEFVLRQAQDGEQSRTISDFDIRISYFPQIPSFPGFMISFGSKNFFNRFINMR